MADIDRFVTYITTNKTEKVTSKDKKALMLFLKSQLPIPNANEVPFLQVQPVEGFRQLEITIANKTYLSKKANFLAKNHCLLFALFCEDISEEQRIQILTHLNLTEPRQRIKALQNMGIHTNICHLLIKKPQTTYSKQQLKQVFKNDFNYIINGL